MARTRPPIAVSTHLIEPGPADAAAAAAAVDWGALFGDAHPVELEVGSGKGLFLANAARANLGRNFLGVEISRKYARRFAAERPLAKQGIANARVWAGDIRDVLARRVPDRSLRAVHVYFPDPWWKQRHKKRRVFTETLLAEIGRAMQPGGELHVASDVEEYFAVIQELIAASPWFHARPMPEAKDPEHDLDYLTNFERKYRLEGRLRSIGRSTTIGGRRSARRMSDPSWPSLTCLGLRDPWYIDGDSELWGRGPMEMSYTAIIQQHGEWWIGWVEEVPGVNSQGATREELLDNLRDALDEALEMNRQDARAAAAGAFEEVSLVP